MKPTILTCAVTGTFPTRAHNPNLPVTPEEIANACIGAAKAAMPDDEARVALLKGCAYEQIIDHPAYNPRQIEWITGLSGHRLTAADNSDYGEHQAALAKLGPTIHHRRSFSPVAARYLDDMDPDDMDPDEIVPAVLPL